MILGASFDTTDVNRAFRDAQSFGYALLSDTDKVAGTAYQVLRAPDHKFANFPERHGYLIDPDGVIRAAYDVTDGNTGAGTVREDLRRLRG